MITLFRRFRDDQAGTTAIEYGVITAILGVVLIASAGGISSTAKTAWNFITTELGKV